MLTEDIACLSGSQKVYCATTEQVWAIHDAMPEHLEDGRWCCSALSLASCPGR